MEGLSLGGEGNLEETRGTAVAGFMLATGPEGRVHSTQNLESVPDRTQRWRLNQAPWPAERACSPTG